MGNQRALRGIEKRNGKANMEKAKMRKEKGKSQQIAI